MDEPIVITFVSDDGLFQGPALHADWFAGHALDNTTHQILYPITFEVRRETLWDTHHQIRDVPAPGGLALTGLALLVMLRRGRRTR